MFETVSYKAASVRFGLVFFCLALCSQAEAITIDELFDSFGNLNTVAGTANIVGGGDNGWQSSMEGTAAISAELSRPHIAMADWNGNIYIADKDAHAIRKVDTDGIITTIAGTNVGGFSGDGVGVDEQLNFPNGLYTFPNGTTYIYDLFNNRIRKLSIDGNLTTIFQDPNGMAVGRGLWVSPDEETIIYASGNEVRQWTDAEGISVVADGFSALGNLTVDQATGNVIATDRGANSVYRISGDGTKVRIAGNGSASGGSSGMAATSVGLDEVRGVYLHPEGGYLLATHDGGQVWFVDDNDRIHLVIDGDDDRSTHAGDGLPLSSPGRKLSEPRAVTLGPNGDLIVTEHDGGYIRVAPANVPFEMGDFNQDRQLDAADVDALSQAVRDTNNPQTMDLTFDALVNDDDRIAWVVEQKQTYFGDANLDGVFNSSDFVQAFAAGKYEDDIPDNAGWAEGDWSGDGEFTSADLVVAFQYGGYDLPPRNAAAVPEPTSTLGALVFSLLVWLRSRR